MVKVYFGTNRKPNRKTKPDDFGRGFSEAGLASLRFGMAEVTGEKLDNYEIFVAPEILRSRADHRADVYALGVTLFEAATGEMPFGIQKFLAGDWGMPGGDQRSEQLAGIIRQACAEELTKRFSTSSPAGHSIPSPSRESTCPLTCLRDSI